MNADFTLPASQLLEMLRDARGRTLALVDDLSDEQLTVPATEIVNPFRWELGHVAFFYDAFVLRLLETDRFMLEGAEHLYDSFSVDHDDRWGLPLPSRKETLAYMERVFARVGERLETGEPDARETYLLLLSILHEDMHGEAFTYMRQTLEYPRPLTCPTLDRPIPGIGSGPHPGDVEIPGGTFQLGALPGTPFVFDNEKWTHPVEVEPFRIARAPVTNAEFAEFVDARGYLQRDLWCHQGWIWRLKTGAQHPVYWIRAGGGWMRRHFDALVPLEDHHPVEQVSWYEAAAYCRWAGRRLPTEAEWDVAAVAEPGPGGRGLSAHKRTHPWGEEAPTPDRANLGARLGGGVDVGAFAAGDSAFGCRQMVGNVWEWTASAFFPFPGYLVDTPYREYSAPWFGYRKVLKGGAWATQSRLARAAYRNFFQPYRRDVSTGFRTCAVDRP